MEKGNLELHKFSLIVVTLDVALIGVSREPEIINQLKILISKPAEEEVFAQHLNSKITSITSLKVTEAANNNAMLLWIAKLNPPTQFNNAILPTIYQSMFAQYKIIFLMNLSSSKAINSRKIFSILSTIKCFPFKNQLNLFYFILFCLIFLSVVACLPACLLVCACLRRDDCDCETSTAVLYLAAKIEWKRNSELGCVSKLLNNFYFYTACLLSCCCFMCTVTHTHTHSIEKDSFEKEPSATSF